MSLLILTLLSSLVAATMYNPSPNGIVVTNNNSLDIFTQTDNPLFQAFRTPTTTYVNLEFDGPTEMDCIISGSKYNCSLTGVDISSKEGTYNINITDNDGTNTTSTITIDHSVTANNFNFEAKDYNVSYTDGCVDTISGIAVSKGQYSNDSFASDINDMSNTSVILPAGHYSFRGYCEDNAGNSAYTGITSYTIPASPPQLMKVTELPNTIICGGGFPCTESYNGSGSPIDISLKLTFDKAANISVVANGGTPVTSDGYYEEHVLSLTNLKDGVHEIEITSTDGTNSEVFEIKLNVSNTGATGNVSIDIRGSIIIDPPIEPYVDFLNSPVVERNNVFAGEWAIVRYEIQTFVYGWTRYRFDSSSSSFDVPIQVFCESNYNTTSKDIINNSLSYNINTINAGIYDETQPAMTCPGTGNFTDGYQYDVLVKYPIISGASPGSISGQFSVGLYNNSI